MMKTIMTLFFCLLSLNCQANTLYNDLIVSVEQSYQSIDNPRQKLKEELFEGLYKEQLIVDEILEIDDRLKGSIICLSLNIYYEARGSTIDDWTMVAYTVINRLSNAFYPMNKQLSNNICNIVFDDYQYSWTNGSPKIPSEKEVWNRIQLFSYDLLTDKQIIEKANKKRYMHYVTYQLYHSKEKPSWINSFKTADSYGYHIYLTN